MRRWRALLIGAAVAVGFAMGWVAGGRQLARHRADLYHPRPLRRFAALSWLEGQGDPETLPVLRDYLTWERHPLLRKRAGRLAARLRGETA